MHDRQKYITLKQAAEIAPGQPSGNCLWRWCRKGVVARNGQTVRLQHIRIGGKLFTTAAWVDEFGRLLAEADANYFKLDTSPAVPLPAAHARSDKQRQAAVERANRELKEMGV